MGYPRPAMSDAPSWETYRTLDALLEEGSLSGAARRLGLTPPTVGRHLDALEAGLGGSLFVRTPRGLVPTDRARTLAPLLAELRRTAAAIERQAQGEATTGRVRITASEMFAFAHLPALLAGLRAEHPGLELELVASDRVDDLLAREADLAVRMTRPRQDGLVARKLGEVRLGLYGRDDYLERRGRPESVAELERFDLVGYDQRTPAIRALLGRVPELGQPHFAFRADLAPVQHALLEAGAGLGFCQTLIAARNPRLQRVLPSVVDLPLEVWLVAHEDLRRSGAVGLVFDGLASGLAELLEAAGSR